MAANIFLNIPVKDLNRSVEFFTKLGYTFNKQFTNENATCMIISDTIFVMLLVEPFFKTFIKKDICDTSKSIEAIIGLSAESREAVQELAKKAIAAGATEGDKQDHGFMYSQAFQDPDGHTWEIIWMNPNHLQG